MDGMYNDLFRRFLIERDIKKPKFDRSKEYPHNVLSHGRKFLFRNSFKLFLIHTLLLPNLEHFNWEDLPQQLFDDMLEEMRIIQSPRLFARNGCESELDEKELNKPEKDIYFTPDLSNTELKQLDLNCLPLNNAFIQKLPIGLKKLNLRSTMIDENAFQYICNLKNVTTLQIDCCENLVFSEKCVLPPSLKVLSMQTIKKVESLEPLKMCKLECLCISGNKLGKSPIDLSCWKVISELTTLKVLIASNTNLNQVSSEENAEVLRSLARNLKNLEVLDISFNFLFSLVTSQEESENQVNLLTMFKDNGFPNLKHLMLCMCRSNVKTIVSNMSEFYELLFSRNFSCVNMMFPPDNDRGREFGKIIEDIQSAKKKLAGMAPEEVIKLSESKSEEEGEIDEKSVILQVAKLNKELRERKDKRAEIVCHTKIVFFDLMNVSILTALQDTIDTAIIDDGNGGKVYCLDTALQQIIRIDRLMNFGKLQRNENGVQKDMQKVFDQAMFVINETLWANSESLMVSLFSLVFKALASGGEKSAVECNSTNTKTLVRIANFLREYFARRSAADLWSFSQSPRSSQILIFLFIVISLVSTNRRKRKVQHSWFKYYEVILGVTEMIETFQKNTRIVEVGFSVMAVLLYRNQEHVTKDYVLRGISLICKLVTNQRENLGFVKMAVAAMTNLTLESSIEKVEEILKPETFDFFVEILKDNKDKDEGVCRQVLGLLWNLSEKDNIRLVEFDRCAEYVFEFRSHPHVTDRCLYHIGMMFANWGMHSAIVSKEENRKMIRTVLLEILSRKVNEFRFDFNGRWGEYSPLFDLYKSQMEIVRQFASWVIVGEASKDFERERILKESKEYGLDFVSAMTENHMRALFYEYLMQNQECRKIITSTKKLNDDFKKLNE